MSRLDIKAQMSLLKEAKSYFKDVQPVSKKETQTSEDSVVLTQEHISAWLEVFYDDKIRMDTCNQASVKM